jgi:TonB family protein
MSLRRLGWTMAALVAVLGATAAGAARALPLDVPVLARQAGSATSLEIRLAEREPGNGLVEVRGPGGTRVYLHPAALATAADVTDASVIDGGDSRFSVAVRFSNAASAPMASATRAHLGRPVAILLDRQVIAAATVRSPVGDSAVLTGNFTEDEARRIAAGLTRTATRPALTPGVAQSTVPRGAAPASGSGRPPGAPASAASVAAARRGARAGSQDRDVRPPVVVSSVNPTYTQAAMDAKIEGHVLLSVVVQADGTVGDVTVTRSLDAVHGLDDQAVDAVRHWTFRPGMKDGAPVAVTVTVEMRFTLE